MSLWCRISGGRRRRRRSWRGVWRGFWRYGVSRRRARRCWCRGFGRRRRGWLLNGLGDRCWRRLRRWRCCWRGFFRRRRLCRRRRRRCNGWLPRRRCILCGCRMRLYQNRCRKGESAQGTADLPRERFLRHTSHDADCCLIDFGVCRTTRLGPKWHENRANRGGKPPHPATFPRLRRFSRGRGRNHRFSAPFQQKFHQLSSDLLRPRAIRLLPNQNA